MSRRRLRAGVSRPIAAVIGGAWRSARAHAPMGTDCALLVLRALRARPPFAPPTIAEAGIRSIVRGGFEHVLGLVQTKDLLMQPDLHAP